MSPVIRAVDPERDLPAIAHIHGQAHPGDPGGSAFLRHRIVDADPAERRLDVVADVDGEVLGYAFTHLDVEADLPGATIAQVMVARPHQSRGIGRALITRLGEHWNGMGSAVVVGHITIHDSMLFAMRQRFAPSSLQLVSRCDLSRPLNTFDVPAGIVLRNLSDDKTFRGMYEVNAQVQNDVHPDDTSYTASSFETWHKTTTADPLLDRDTTVVAFDNDRPVALSWISRSETRAWSVLTGVIPEFRGRGLGRLVKSESLRRAQNNGVTEVFATNSDRNTPILDINKQLGYELYVKQFTVGRILAEPQEG